MGTAAVTVGIGGILCYLGMMATWAACNGGILGSYSHWPGTPNAGDLLDIVAHPGYGNMILENWCEDEIKGTGELQADEVLLCDTSYDHAKGVAQSIINHKLPYFCLTWRTPSYSYNFVRNVEHCTSFRVNWISIEPKYPRNGGTVSVKAFFSREISTPYEGAEMVASAGEFT